MRSERGIGDMEAKACGRIRWSGLPDLAYLRSASSGELARYVCIAIMRIVLAS